MNAKTNPQEPACPSCGQPFTMHEGIILTCARLHNLIEQLAREDTRIRDECMKVLPPNYVSGDDERAPSIVNLVARLVHELEKYQARRPKK